MVSLPNNTTAVINKINNNVISYIDASNATDMLPYFLANGRAFYDNLFMPAMRGEHNAKNLQETIDVSTVRLDRKIEYHY